MKHQNNKTTPNPKKVELTFSEKHLTTHAGLIPVIHWLNQIGLSQLLSSKIRHPRGANSTYFHPQIIEMLIIAMMAGAESIESASYIWQDLVLQKVRNWKSIPVDTTISRILKEMGQREAYELRTVNAKLRNSFWEKLVPVEQQIGMELRGVTLDMDSTVVTKYGSQPGVEKGYNPTHKGKKSYHPQLAFCEETKDIIQGYLRPGDVHTSHGGIEFLKELFETISPKKYIREIRCDSGYFGGDLLDFLSDTGVYFTVKANLRHMKSILLLQEWEPCPSNPDFEVCTFYHQLNSWSRAHRFVGLRIKKSKMDETIDDSQMELFNSEAYQYLCYSTNWILPPMLIHEGYKKRTYCENLIEEVKNQSAFLKMCTNDFWANEILMQCSILCINLLHWLRASSNNQTLKKWEVKTIRTFILRTAAKMVLRSNQIKIRLPKIVLRMRVWKIWIKTCLA